MSNNRNDAVSAIYNYVDAIDDENPALRSVVINSKGMAKPLAGVSVVNETTYQVYDPSAGDIILQAKQPVSYPDGTYETVDINVITIDGSDASSPEELLDESIVHATIDFLGNPDNTVRHYTLDGVTDVIRGDSLNAMYARRKALGELFKDCEPQVRDNLVNWLDNEENANVLDGKVLDWDRALDIPEILQIAYHYHSNPNTPSDTRHVNTAGTSILTWHKTEDEDKERVIYNSLAGLETSVNERTTQLNWTELVEVADDVTKVLILNVSNGALTSLTMHTPDGFSSRLVPHYRVSVEELLSHSEMTDYLYAVDLDEEEFDTLISPNQDIEVNNMGWDIPESDLTPEEVMEAYIQYTLGHESEELYDEIRLWCSDDASKNAIYIPPYGDNIAQFILFKTSWLSQHVSAEEEDDSKLAKYEEPNQPTAPDNQDASDTVENTTTPEIEGPLGTTIKEKTNASSDAQQSNL